MSGLFQRIGDIVADKHGIGNAGSSPRFTFHAWLLPCLCGPHHWAIMIGVSEIHLHGCDYIGCRPSERAGMEYWLGRAEDRGIKVRINKDSHLLRTEDIDNINMHVENLYGYLEEPKWLTEAQNQAKVKNGKERAKRAKRAS